MVVAYGIDVAWNRPPVAICKNHGVQFVCGYVSWDTTKKNITLPEVNNYLANGIDYVCNWEYLANEATEGRAKGVESATEAVRQAVYLGIPAGRPIYFSVDDDVDPNTVDDYFVGAANTCWNAGLQIGVYGSEAVCRYLFTRGRVAYTWRTMSTAWQNDGMPFSFNIIQTKQTNLDSYDVDLNQALTPDYGQWTYQEDGMALDAVYEQKLKDFLDGIITPGNVNKRMLEEILTGVDPAPNDPSNPGTYVGLKQIAERLDALAQQGVTINLSPAQTAALAHAIVKEQADDVEKAG